MWYFLELHESAKIVYDSPIEISLKTQENKFICQKMASLRQLYNLLFVGFIQHVVVLQKHDVADPTWLGLNLSLSSTNT